MTALSTRSEITDISGDADLDPLTGAMTRQSFFQRLIERAAVANATARTFGICLINADQLKNINQSHGQQTGDEVLAQVTRRIRLDLSVSLPDISEVDLCRYDGNGFALLIPDSDLERTAEAAESLRRAINATEVQLGLRVTISVGVSQYRLWETAEDTLARADHALHLAKQFGRDRVEVAASPPSRAEAAEVIPLERSA